MSIDKKKQLIDINDPNFSISKQCEMLRLERSTLYYKPVPISLEDQKIMNRIDQIYTECPFYGSRKIRKQLNREGVKIGRDKVCTLMRKMGLEAIYPKKNFSKKNHEHKIYPYLLKDVKIVRPNQVWSTDITYIRMNKGFLYLVAILDWFSRYVVSWKLSNCLESDFCVEALNDALTKGAPEIFNTDQGSQFTCNDFTSVLLNNEIKISMDAKGRVFDNIFVERLWRSVKYEEVYLKNYGECADAQQGLKNYFELYNNRRIHQSLDYKTPFEVHNGVFN